MITSMSGEGWAHVKKGMLVYSIISGTPYTIQKAGKQWWWYIGDDHGVWTRDGSRGGSISAVSSISSASRSSSSSA